MQGTRFVAKSDFYQNMEPPKLPANVHWSKDLGRNRGSGWKREEKIPFGEVTALQSENQVLRGAGDCKDGHI